MSLNVKSISVDTDSASTRVIPLSAATSKIYFVRGNEYILQANCYANSNTNVFSSFSTDDTWGLYMGSEYQGNASPVVVVTDSAKWNQVADWSQANVQSGQICCRVNVNGSALTTDIANSASKNYTMQIVLNNNSAAQVMVNESTVTIGNAVQL
jgi:hypothetical protein